MMYDGLGYLLVLTGTLSESDGYTAHAEVFTSPSGTNILNLLLYKTAPDIQVSFGTMYPTFKCA